MQRALSLARAAGGADALRQWIGDRSTSGAFLALVLLLAANILFVPNFATASNAWNILLQVSPVLLVSVGMTLVIATGGIDLSVGSVMALGAALAATQMEHGPAVAIVAGLLGALAVGLLNGWLVAAFQIQPIIVTLATLIAVRGVAQVVSHDGQLVTIDAPAFLAFGRGHVGGIPIPVLIALAFAAAAVFLLRATTLGRYILAVGGNLKAARLAGVRVKPTLLFVYAAGAVLSGIAGMIMAARLGASDAAKIGQLMELDAIAAVVVGGTALLGGRATVVGTVIGALIMQVIATSFNMLLLPYAYSLVLKAAIIVVAVYVQRRRPA